MATSKTRTTALTIGGTLLAIGAAAVSVLLFGRRPNGEHTAPDLALDTPRPGPDDRAPEAFRPDPTAIPTAAERDSLRPATGHAPGFAADRGTTVQEPVGA
ncbi:hypothetical protein [Sphingomonas oligophenolica]|uniref:Uncharacterized protein n=1 Tax=Sphingomonas oligophenolica TaxID=301154 RepID=A0A502CQ14_9SPHN|nr:hypothetical protein [Sphingomonas oligophenolica]TPG15307.1 hypothetical protein EAH84_00315 [Sphingomonas oligophenolica]